MFTILIVTRLAVQIAILALYAFHDNFTETVEKFEVAQIYRCEVSHTILRTNHVPTARCVVVRRQSYTCNCNCCFSVEGGVRT